ncbi:probable CCR4-associated factor 1 homolog 9 [Vigna angularis]|uniref:probable CCR4-associated factor 1 homolog 9 n=1 Tax=Phaseolus angularis TaxID=3914 RepID=UPI00080A6ACD|nr:probable CCR4-associated factor 1 homolog 9 [Vigna angularis]
MAMSYGAVMTRSVWSCNLEAEFELIRRVIKFFPFISMDTEFPGVIFQLDPAFRQPKNNYAMMKANVDRMHLIQVGLTLSDRHGNLPTFGTSNRFIWEFNFCEFDVTRHLHASQSIALLQSQGMDFHKNQSFGANIMRFVELLMFSGLLCNNHIHWITFHGAYDFAYLVKVLSYRFLHMQPLLPPNLGDFLHLVKFFFGQEVYDVKYLIKFCPNLYGGLDRVSKSLGLDNSARKSHHAGSDSLVTLHVFNEIKRLYFHTDDDLKKYVGVVYGLEMS